jgi:hypothetical protein
MLLHICIEMLQMWREKSRFLLKIRQQEFLGNCWVFRELFLRIESTSFFTRTQSWTKVFKSNLLYSHKQKHVLLFRKSEILLFIVSITNMPEYFFRNKTFLVLKIESWNFLASYWWGISWILTKFQLIRTTFIFRSPCYYLSSNSVSSMGCY